MKYIKNPNTKCTCSNPNHHALWVLNKTGILRSIEAIFKNNTMDKLTKDAYQFAHNMSGFIAHYDMGGFKAYYENVEDFRSDLLRSSDITDAFRYVKDDYFSKQEQAQYYADKTKVLVGIKNLCEKYAGTTKGNESELVENKVAILKELVKRAEADPAAAKKILSSIGLI